MCKIINRDLVQIILNSHLHTSICELVSYRSLALHGNQETQTGLQSGLQSRGFTKRTSLSGPRRNNPSGQSTCPPRESRDRYRSIPVGPGGSDSEEPLWHLFFVFKPSKIVFLLSKQRWWLEIIVEHASNWPFLGVVGAFSADFHLDAWMFPCCLLQWDPPKDNKYNIYNCIIDQKW